MWRFIRSARTCWVAETGWQMREEIARVVPFYEGVQHLRKTGDAIQYGGLHLCANGQFPTADGKAHFRVVELPLTPSDGERGRQDGAGHFIVSTRRGKTIQFADLTPRLIPSMTPRAMPY